MKLFTLLLIQVCSLYLGESTGYDTIFGNNHFTNTSAKVQRGRFKRSFASFSDVTLDIDTTFSLTIPLPDFGTSLSVFLPFFFSFPTEAASSRSLQVRNKNYGNNEWKNKNFEYNERQSRSYSAFPTMASKRNSIFSTIETYINGLGGGNGASCIERAICEVAATPEHEDGIIGDAMNYILRVDKEAFDEHPKYALAQQIGENTGDCFEFYNLCPVSIFNIRDTFQSG